MRWASALILVALTLTACGTGGSGQTGQNGQTGRGGGPVEGGLTVTVVDSPGAPPRTWTLTCDPPGGDHPRAPEACAQIDAAPRAFLPKPADLQCTQVYGGPQTATITGTWRGTPVNASYKRTDGCEIARWNALSAVLGS